MRKTPPWIHWLVLALVLLIGSMGAYASASCHCGHEDAAAHETDACDACDGVCSCHLTIVPWYPPCVPHVQVRLHETSDSALVQEGGLYAQLIYSPPRR